MLTNDEKIASLRQQIHEGIERVRRSIEAAKYLLTNQEPIADQAALVSQVEQTEPRKTA